jgi:hypothetical protein
MVINDTTEHLEVVLTTGGATEVRQPTYQRSEWGLLKRSSQCGQPQVDLQAPWPRLRASPPSMVNVEPVQ